MDTPGDPWACFRDEEPSAQLERQPSYNDLSCYELDEHYSPTEPIEYNSPGLKPLIALDEDDDELLVVLIEGKNAPHVHVEEPKRLSPINEPANEIRPDASPRSRAASPPAGKVSRTTSKESRRPSKRLPARKNGESEEADLEADSQTADLQSADSQTADEPKKRKRVRKDESELMTLRLAQMLLSIPNKTPRERIFRSLILRLMSEKDQHCANPQYSDLPTMRDVINDTFARSSIAEKVGAKHLVDEWMDRVFEAVNAASTTAASTTAVSAIGTSTNGAGSSAADSGVSGDAELLAFSPFFERSEILLILKFLGVKLKGRRRLSDKAPEILLDAISTTLVDCISRRVHGSPRGSSSLTSRETTRELFFSLSSDRLNPDRGFRSDQEKAERPLFRNCRFCNRLLSQWHRRKKPIGKPASQVKEHVPASPLPSSQLSGTSKCAQREDGSPDAPFVLSDSDGASNDENAPLIGHDDSSIEDCELLDGSVESGDGGTENDDGTGSEGESDGESRDREGQRPILSKREACTELADGPDESGTKFYRSKTFCHSGCLYCWKLLAGASFIRYILDERDEGICSSCGLDTSALLRVFRTKVSARVSDVLSDCDLNADRKKLVFGQIVEDVLLEAAPKSAACAPEWIALLASRAWKRFSKRRKRSYARHPILIKAGDLWQADHIVPVCLQGGLSPFPWAYRTLCTICHLNVTNCLRVTRSLYARLQPRVNPDEKPRDEISRASISRDEEVSSPDEEADSRATGRVKAGTEDAGPRAVRQRPLQRGSGDREAKRRRQEPKKVVGEKKPIRRRVPKRI